ncbi:MAG: hydroxyacid dehydrogenase, partial [Paenibacillus sp.]|nr:hydroxyacid dehydrogenase [Paenibacillus sp.]
MKAIIVRSNFPNHAPEQEVFAAAGWELVVGEDDSPEQLVKAGQEADAALVQFSIVTKAIMQQWTRCKLIVRYGIGYDNVDVEAAAELGIQVCNVTSYCLDEVADHASALIIASARKLFQANRAIEQGIWGLESIKPLPKLEHTLVGIIGLGRIGERVLQRLKPFKLQ